MKAMAKKKPKPDQPSEVGGSEKKRYPSREKTKYVAIPKALYEALESYAKSRSDEDDTKSISWAARVAIRNFLQEAGHWPPKQS